MSKLKNAQLEESALVVAEKLLVEIELYIDNMNFADRQQVKILKDLISAYNELKPYL